MYICTLYDTTLSFLALFCLRSKRVATCIMVRYVPHLISSYSICVSLSILKLDLNVKHWYKKIYSMYFIVSSYNFSRNITISEMLQVWNLLPAGNVINYMHISYIIDILYNRTNFMSNISFNFKFIMDWMNKDDIFKII